MFSFKKILISLFSIHFMLNCSGALAAPPENELNQYLSQIGMTKQELIEYLDFYEISLDDFSTVEELRLVTGTPINSQNMQELLTRYDLSEKELKDLMDHFGDTVSDYEFIEDLDATVEFYVHHDDYMADIESGLKDLGITEEETEKFFNYLSQVEENNKNQLDLMEALDVRMEEFINVNDPSELSDEQVDELVQILEESIALYEIKVKFAVNNKDITLKELLKMKEAPQNLYASIYSSAGEPLIDFTLPDELFETGQFLDDGEDMIHVGELSDEYIDYMHEEKYEDAQKGLK